MNNLNIRRAVRRVPVWAIRAFQAGDQATWATPLERCSLQRQALSRRELCPDAEVEALDWQRRQLENRSRDVDEAQGPGELLGVVQRLVRLEVGGNALVGRRQVTEDLYCRSLSVELGLG